MTVDATVIIRTYNEERFLDELLSAILVQKTDRFTYEIVVVDSGSTDRTLEIASKYNCRIVPIKKEDFTFGRSLNYGCEAAKGRFLLMISGHCVPVGDKWLENLVAPLDDGIASYSYGRQIGRQGYSKYSEFRLFEKYFPAVSAIPQDGFFCNNANSAITKELWQRMPFDEELTGLEDMALAKKMVAAGGKVAYTADSLVEHIHEESWRQVKTRYEREAIALQEIMPEVHLTFRDFLRYSVSGILHDFASAINDRAFLKYFAEIIAFRVMQYWGSYRGNNDHRRLSKARKDMYFYPR